MWGMSVILHQEMAVALVLPSYLFLLYNMFVWSYKTDICKYVVSSVPVGHHKMSKIKLSF